MSQFDVYVNPSLSTREAFPYIIDIQNPLISEIATRMVIPLGKMSYFNSEQMKRLTPIVEYENEKLLLLTPQIASVQTNRLKNPVGSLSHFRDEIIASLDFAISGV